MSQFLLPLKPSIHVFLGDPGAGKSFALASMLYQYSQAKHFKFGICFTGSKFQQQFTYLPDQYVHDGYDEEKLKAHIENLRKKTDELKKQTGDPEALPPPNFVILDDCGSTVNPSSWYRQWVFTYRHTNTSVFMLVQYLADPRGAGTFLRKCTKFAYMWPTMDGNDLESMFHAFGGTFGSGKQGQDKFRKALKKVMERDHACLVFRRGHKTVKESYVDLLAPEFPKDFKLEY